MAGSNREVIALTGRGGAGKTTVTSIMIKILSGMEGKRLFAVDADPPTGLTYALGSKPVKTVGEIRQEIIENPAERRRFKSRETRDILFDDALMEVNGVSLLVMGRAEGQGCFCSINEILKYGIETLSKEYDVTFVDCEAGIEQVNRRVISAVNTLIIVSDASVRGIQTAAQLTDIVGRYTEEKPPRTVLVVNKAGEGDRAQLAEIARQYGLEIAGFVPVDENVMKYSLTDRAMTELPDASPAVEAVREILKRLNVI